MLLILLGLLKPEQYSFRNIFQKTQNKQTKKANHKTKQYINEIWSVKAIPQGCGYQLEQAVPLRADLAEPEQDVHQVQNEHSGVVW